MPTITRVEPQKQNARRANKNKSPRFNIFIDEKFAFGIDAQNLLELKINVGTRITSEEIEKIQKLNLEVQLLDSALNFLSFRPRSEKEMQDYLIKKIVTKEKLKFSDARENQLIQTIIKRLKKNKYLNDKEFTLWWLESRKFRPKGKAHIKMELIKKGVDRSIIDENLTVDEMTLAKKAVFKKIEKWKNLSPIDFKKKFYSYLASRGFSFDTINEVFAFYRNKS